MKADRAREFIAIVRELIGALKDEKRFNPDDTIARLDADINSLEDRMLAGNEE